MRDSKKAGHCSVMAKKCVAQAECYSFCANMAPTPSDYNYACRKFNRAIRHAKKYVSLMEYYGGVR